MLLCLFKRSCKWCVLGIRNDMSILCKLQPQPQTNLTHTSYMDYSVCSLVGFSQSTVFFSHNKPAPASPKQPRNQTTNMPIVKKRIQAKQFRNRVMSKWYMAVTYLFASYLITKYYNRKKKVNATLFHAYSIIAWKVPCIKVTQTNTVEDQTFLSKKIDYEPCIKNKSSRTSTTFWFTHCKRQEAPGVFTHPAVSKGGRHVVTIGWLGRNKNLFL